jgi:hypothetical protein
MRGPDSRPAPPISIRSEPRDKTPITRLKTNRGMGPWEKEWMGVTSTLSCLPMPRFFIFIRETDRESSVGGDGEWARRFQKILTGFNDTI